MKKVTLTQRNKHEMIWAKSCVIFANGVEVKLPTGWVFDSKFSILGLKKSATK